MEFLARDPRVIFLGQAVAYPGTAMTGSMEGIDVERRIEMPVCEEMQLGMSIGLAANGLIPVSIFPRWNFLLLATNQLVNHLDKLNALTRGELQHRVIIRTGIGSERPLHPHVQHVGDFTDAFRMMCPNVDILRLEEPEDVLPAYEKALVREDGKSTIVVEYGDFHGEK